MSQNNTSPDFPRTEEFVDFAGKTRRFTVTFDPTPIGHCVTAVEDVEGDDGYVFQASSSVDPFQALGDLR